MTNNNRKFNFNKEKATAVVRYNVRNLFRKKVEDDSPQEVGRAHV